MKRSGCRTIFHICLIFVLSLLGALLMAVCLFFLTITIRKPDGKTARSDWPIRFTEEFKDQIIFAEFHSFFNRRLFTLPVIRTSSLTVSHPYTHTLMAGFPIPIPFSKAESVSIIINRL